MASTSYSLLASPELLAHSSQFEKQLYQPAGNVYTAVGYAASNVHFMVAPFGVVVEDTIESPQAAANILADIRKICDCISR